MRNTVVKKTISLKADVWEYISSQAKNNASAFINEALCEYRVRRVRRAMVEGYKAMASDDKLAKDMALWDTTLQDGFNDEEDPEK
jgi:hypothetical protein